jgi:type IV pilus assembly protein PilX
MKIPQFQKAQKGAILFISLIILLILTILGLASMQNSIMQEKMTAAVRDGRVALEGGEAGLHFVEQQVVEDLNTINGFNNSGCLYEAGAAPRQSNSGVWQEIDADGDWVDSDIWSDDTKTCEITTVNVRTSSGDGSDGSLAANPRYFIEHAGVLTDEDSTNIMMFNYNNNAGSGDIHGFKIVVRSVGSSATSQRYVSSYYGKRI